MISIQPDLSNDFFMDFITSEVGQVSLQIALDERNHIEIHTGDNPGLWLDNESATPIIGEGFISSTDDTKIRVGYATPFGDRRLSPYMITLDSKVERIFDSSSEDGSDLQGFRPIDVVLAGDMYRVPDTSDPSKYKWYLVTEVSDEDDDDTNNSIISSEYLGTW